MSQYTFKYSLHVIKPYGKIVYEYNPLYNFRLSSSNYLKNAEGSYLSADRQVLTDVYPVGGQMFWNGSKLVMRNGLSVPKLTNSQIVDSRYKYGFGFVENSTDPLPLVYQDGGIIQDLITGTDGLNDVLNFDLNHPVSIIAQEIYNGSVNLIFSDEKNLPRLINTRFCVQQNNTYVRTEQIGSDTSIYDYDSFQSQSSLTKFCTNIPDITLQSILETGNLKIGQYQFFFKLSDGDGNTTNFIGNSDLINIVIGSVSSISSIRGGQLDEQANKSVIFSITNIDSAFSYVRVYYTRQTGKTGSESITSFVEIDVNYKITNKQCSININGYESTIPHTLSELYEEQVTYENVKTLTLCQNRLFLGNVLDHQDNFKELIRLSLNFLPFYQRIDSSILVGYVQHDYATISSKKAYYDAKNCAEYVGYWPNEFYRLGIVYVRKDGTLTGVYNIRGIIDLPNVENIKVSDQIVTPYYSDKANKNGSAYEQAACFNPYTNPDSSDFNIDLDTFWINKTTGENCAGVIKFPDQEFVDENRKSNLCIYSLAIKVSDETISDLRKLGYVGFFMVRQKRIPNILCQGFVQGLMPNSGVPALVQNKGGMGNHVLLSSFKWAEKSNEQNFYIYDEFFTESFLKANGQINDSELTPALIKAPEWQSSDNPNDQSDSPIYIAPSLSQTKYLYAPDIFFDQIIQSQLSSLQLMYFKQICEPLHLHESTERHYYSTYNYCYKSYENSLTKYQAIWIPENTTIRINSDTIFRTIAGSADSIKYVSCTTKDISKKYLPIKSNFNTTKEKRKSRRWLKVLLGATAIVAMAAATCFTCGALAAPSAIVTGLIIGGLTTGASALAAAASQVQDVITGGEPVGSTGTTLIEDNFEPTKYTGTAVQLNTNYQTAYIVRGIYGAGLAVLNANSLQYGSLVNIYRSNPTSQADSVQIRFNDTSAYYSISKRYSLDSHQIEGTVPTDSVFSVFSGDCYISTFTQRLIRNFSDPDAPTNTQIVDENTWINNWNPDKKASSSVNRGDVNAAPLGMWLSFVCRTNKNIAFRDTDPNNPAEESLYGQKRGFYPYFSQNPYMKIPESVEYNPAYTTSTGVRAYYQQPVKGVNQNKSFSKIAYSEPYVSGVKNGLRIFLNTNYETYTVQYGGIQKLITINDQLLVVFEHAVGIVYVNQQSMIQSDSGAIELSGKNVLSNSIKILSDTFGTQWPESVVETNKAIYGLDTVAKKIWCVSKNTLEMKCISDFAIQSFLIDNITLTERELSPIIGIRNVKTHYNANKQDVMFTFYDNTNGFEETSWNLCYNEILEKWITFYSWIPSYSANIYNTYFSFDRNASKWISKLAMSISGPALPVSQQTINIQYDTIASGICVDSVIIDTWFTSN